MNIAQNDGIPLQHGLTDWLTGQHARERKLTKQQGAMMREKPETTKQLNTRHKKQTSFATTGPVSIDER